jgi:hypothetical protein
MVVLSAIRRSGILLVAPCLLKNGSTGIRNRAMDRGRSSIVRKLFRLKLALMGVRPIVSNSGSGETAQTQIRSMSEQAQDRTAPLRRAEKHAVR